MPYAARTIASPVGPLTLVARDSGLVALLWAQDRPGRVRLAEPTTHGAYPVLRSTEQQLAEYFVGSRRAFDLPLDLTGTDFQREVWAALLAIPFGATSSYGAVARAIGRPGASRAVGAAVGRNPVSIIVPCHRAVGATGLLTGFAGGLDAKSYLLALEARGGKGRGWHPVRKPV